MKSIYRCVLALDLSSRIGWCCGPPGEKPGFGHHQLPKTGDDIGWFAVAYEDWLREMIESRYPDLIVFESPILPRQTSIMTVRKLSGLTFETERFCSRSQIPCREIQIQKIKMFVTGKGNADKDMMVAGVKRMGFNVACHDEADAIGAWHVTEAMLIPSKSMKTTPLFSGRI